jgi:hypothetical protein
MDISKKKKEECMAL